MEILVIFHLILFILTGNDDMHESSEEFEIQCNQTTGCRVGQKKIPIYLWGKRCCHFFKAVFNQILFIHTGNNNMHESLECSKLGTIRPLTAELAAL